MKEGKSKPKSLLRGNRKQIAAIVILSLIVLFHFLQESSQTAHLANIGQSGSPEEDRNGDGVSIPFLTEIQDFLEHLLDILDKESDQEEEGPSSNDVDVQTPFGITLNVEQLLLVLFLAIAIGLLAVAYYFLIAKSRVPRLTEEEEMQRRLDRLGERLERIIEFIERCEAEEKFTEGVIKGYQELDRALWDFSRLQRRKYDTPLEHTQTIAKRLAVDRLLRIVEQFYSRRYRMVQASKADLLEFKESLEALVPSKALRMKPDWKEQEEDAKLGD